MANDPRHREIIHLDLDAFYASVEMLDNPEIAGKPVIVGGGGKRGVVTAASYEARKFGVHSAQPVATARRLCPDGVFLPVRMGRYKEMSDRVFEIFRRFSPLVEALSIDEGFLDVTGTERLFGGALEVARKIKEGVASGTGLAVSAGDAGRPPALPHRRRRGDLPDRDSAAEKDRGGEAAGAAAGDLRFPFRGEEVPAGGGGADPPLRAAAGTAPPPPPGGP